MRRSSEPIRETAIVLRTIRHGETSRIVTLLGNTLGKFSVIAKGARNAKTSSLNNLEPPCLIDAIVHFKTSRSVQIISQAQSLNNYPQIRCDLVRTGYMLAALQIIERTSTEGDPSKETYDNIAKSLQLWNDCPTIDPRFILWKFQMELYASLGFELSIDECAICRNNPVELGNKVLFSSIHGGFCCPDCVSEVIGGNNVSGESVMLIKRIIKDPLIRCERLRCSKTARSEVSSLLKNYLKVHLPDLGEMKALKILEQFEETK